ncbi:MAG TPA: hypothetical protein VFI70_09700, partial [Nitrososphaeraceae archaeon]|nr:hypothetical protein [Nitrososphaeraceae archaeon]
MPDKSNTLNIDDETLMDWLVKSIKSVENGRIVIDMGNEPAMQINAAAKRIDIDLLHPELFKLFKISEDEDEDKRGRMDKLKDKLNTAKE